MKRTTPYVIQVKNLGKKYKLGATLRHDTLRDHLMNCFKSICYRMCKKDRFNNKKKLFGSLDSYDTDEFWALKDVSFKVKQGEVVGIIGRNGAGKSTLLKIISQITEPTQGEISIRGRVSSLLEVGTGFHPELTGRENIFLNGAVLGMTRIEIKRKFDEIVAFSELVKFIDTPVKRYSSGMTVRLGFSVAAHLEPEILLVDEVLAVGDVAFQKKCLGKMEEVSKKGRTILFVSHNMATISALCNRCIYLRKGNIQKNGDPEEIIFHYLEDFKAEYNKPIAKRTDRNGDGRVRIIDIRFLDGLTHRPVDILITGQNVYIEITYKSQDSFCTQLNRFNIGLGFFTSLGQFVMVLNSEMANRAFESLPPDGHVYCHIPKLPLMSGTFNIRVTLQLNGKMADQLLNAMSIHIEAGDFFGTGISKAPRGQGIFVNHSWSTRII